MDAYNKQVTITEKNADEKDGHVKIECEAYDNAGNVVRASDLFYIDKDAPVIENITFSAGGTDDMEVVPMQYGFFFKKKTTVSVEVTDYVSPKSQKQGQAGAENLKTGSGVCELTYYLENNKHEKTKETVISSSKMKKTADGRWITSFAVPQGFKGQIFIKVKDNVGQETGFQNPKGTVIENLEAHTQHSKAEIVLPETNYKDGEGNALYADYPQITFVTTDSASGIGQNEWAVKPFHLGENEADGILTVSATFDEKKGVWRSRLTGDNGWSVNGKLDKNLVTKASKSYVVKNQMNHIDVKLKLTDNAGNSLEETKETFSVDTTKPVIKVEYDNNDVLHDKYYKEPRTATITVTERNFYTEGVELKLTGDNIKTGEWQHAAGGGCNGTVHTDECQYVCNVTFDEDGEYSLGLRVTDMAGNEEDYGQIDEFVIDQTKPVIEVTYDNNDAKNGNFYNEKRTASVLVTEKNFDEYETHIQVKASVKGSEVGTPVPSKFTKGEEENTCTLSFEDDADYDLDITVTDLAGNEADVFTPQSFTIDTTPPELSVEGVENGSANKGVVRPVITYTDINLETESVMINLRGANNGKVSYESVTEKIEDGRKEDLGDFKYVKKVDDLYTMEVVVEDLAGNESTDTRTFSVNRFGSVYILSDMTQQLVDDYYTNRGQDLSVREINVDTLEFLEIDVSRDGDIVTLKNGDDYEVKSKKTDYSWKEYEYHIFADNFEDELAYTVSIYSEDRAQNKSSNKAKGKELEFVVDKTKPSIVVGGVEDGGRYRQVEREIIVGIQDNILLSKAAVYIDGRLVTTIGQEELLENNGEVRVLLSGSNKKQSLTVKAEDAAGNVAESGAISFLITNNLLIQWYSNPFLFYGSIVLLVLITFLIVYLQKKRSQNTSFDSSGVGRIFSR